MSGFISKIFGKRVVQNQVVKTAEQRAFDISHSSVKYGTISDETIRQNLENCYEELVYVANNARVKLYITDGIHIYDGQKDISQNDIQGMTDYLKSKLLIKVTHPYGRTSNHLMSSQAISDYKKTSDAVAEIISR